MKDTKSTNFYEQEITRGDHGTVMDRGSLTKDILFTSSPTSRNGTTVNNMETDKSD
jgi:hypothetical protein